MHKSESAQENLQKKGRTCRLLDLVKTKENEMRDKSLDLGRKSKQKAIEHEGDGDSTCNWCVRNNPQMVCQVIGIIGNQKTSLGHPTYSIVKIGQNTEKSPEDLRRLAVTTVKDHQITLVLNASKK